MDRLEVWISWPQSCLIWHVHRLVKIKLKIMRNKANILFKECVKTLHYTYKCGNTIPKDA